MACLAPDAATFLPDFLIISPPKTGSTWLASNLRCHPGIYIPDIKEVKYFSTFYRWLDLNWYARHFQPGGTRSKGEASPSYCLLPRRLIRLIRTLMPDLKLIFLMRDPPSRAWSHARHSCQYREANFQTCTASIDEVPAEAWRENFVHPWLWQSGNYRSQLGRWLESFPRAQMFIGFYEDIHSDPTGLLTRIMRFLGVSPPCEWSDYRISEVILPGPKHAMPADLDQELRLLFSPGTHRLRKFLQVSLGLSLPGQWAEPESCNSREATVEPLDDAQLETLLAENDASSPRVMEQNFQGYQIVIRRGRFFAIPHACTDVDGNSLGDATGGIHPSILIADTLDRAKEVVLHVLIRDMRNELAGLHSGHARLQAQLDQSLALITSCRDTLLAQQRELAKQLAECQTFVARMRDSIPFRLRRRLTRLFK
jgi:hypothetical protein